MQTTSSRALLHRSPSSCQLLYRTSGCRTSTPLGRGNRHYLSLRLSFLFCLCFSSLIITISPADGVFCCFSSAACSSWGPFWSSRPLSCTATKASHPPTPAGRRTLTADTTAAVGGPVEASGRGGERRTESCREKEGERSLSYIVITKRKRRQRSRKRRGKQVGNRRQEEWKKKVIKIIIKQAQSCDGSHTPKVPQLRRVTNEEREPWRKQDYTFFFLL